MLKPYSRFSDIFGCYAAAFGRLCVETLTIERLNVEQVAAAFGRLCVETLAVKNLGFGLISSRLRAAVC